jgi:hypothetical protein
LFRATNGSASSDTWLWDGSTWTNASATADAIGTGAACAYDLAHARVVLFGGMSAGTEHGDAWAWSGGGWSRVAASASPDRWVLGAMTFDAARNRVLYVCSPDPSGNLPVDTWEWDGSAWTLRTPQHDPPGRLGPALAFDAGRKKAVLVGGFSYPGTAGRVNHTDTWEWDGTDWALAQPATSPPPLYNAVMTHDRGRGRTVLCGTASQPFLRFATWEYDGVDWKDRSTLLMPPANWPWR